MPSSAAIVKWGYIDDQVVSLHLAGYSNKKISKIVKRTPERVSQILNDPQALALINQAGRSLRAKIAENIENELLLAAEKSMDRINETLDCPMLPGTKAKQHQDRTALEILKGTGFLSKDLDPDARKGSKMDPAVLERLTAAMEKANLAKEVNNEIIQDANFSPSNS